MNRVSKFCFALFVSAISLAPAGDPLTRYGLPDTGDVHIRKGYMLGYDGRLRGARWTLEMLTRENLKGSADRVNLSFHEDEDVLPEARSRPRDYEQSGYDIGHMAPAGDHTHSLSELRDTFRLSNAHPQLPNFNRIRWQELESLVRKLLDDGEVAAVYVLTGPLWICDGSRLTVHYVGTSEIPVATHFFKSVLIEKTDGTIEPRTWIVEHVRDPGELERARVSIDDLERWAGFDAWPKLSEDLEQHK